MENKNYYGNPTYCSKCGRPTEKKRNRNLPNTTCMRCQKKQNKITIINRKLLKK